MQTMDMLELKIRSSMSMVECMATSRVQRHAHEFGQNGLLPIKKVSTRNLTFVFNELWRE